MWERARTRWSLCFVRDGLACVQKKRRVCETTRHGLRQQVMGSSRGMTGGCLLVSDEHAGRGPGLIAASMYSKYSAGPSIRPICTRNCFTMTNMLEVCSNFHRAREFRGRGVPACQRRARRPWPRSNIYEKYSVCPFSRPIRTRCCFTMTKMNRGVQ